MSDFSCLLNGQMNEVNRGDKNLPPAALSYQGRESNVDSGLMFCISTEYAVTWDIL